MLAGLGGLGYWMGSGAINKARKVSTLAMATDLENSINQFYLDYAALPNPGTSKLSHDIVFDTVGPEGQKLLSILMAMESVPALQNTKKIRFFIGRPGAGGKNGVITLPSGLSELKDPWRNPYHVVLNGDDNEAMTPPADSGSPVPVRGRRVLV